MLRLRGIFPDKKRRRLWLRGGAVALVIYLVAMFPLGCGKILADRLMLFPSTDPRPSFGAVENFVQTPAGRVQVFVARGPSAMARSPERYVVRFEGNGGRAEYTATDIALRWNDRPTEVWAANHPGFGASEGPAAMDKLGPAALAVYDEVCRVAGDLPVFVDADSMGTTMALHVAVARRESRPVAGLVLKNPPPLRKLVLGRFGWWNLWLAAGPIALALPGELDSIANARKLDGVPAVFLSAGSDSLIPPRYQRTIYDAHAGPTRWVVFEDADHNTPIDDETEAEVRAAMAELFDLRP